jgi:hypothetical protein
MDTFSRNRLFSGATGKSPTVTGLIRVNTARSMRLPTEQREDKNADNIAKHLEKIIFPESTATCQIYNLGKFGTFYEAYGDTTPFFEEHMTVSELMV